ncbi:MAG: hypothetical protein QF722_02190 [Candidatus Thalassarchaeaceae archaeon]|nr:hypothetical protein [Candidatus Thalassarchaeaceae archaeon]
MLPADVLAKLDAMDDYDRMLAYDRIGRDHRMSAAEVESQFNAWKSGGALPSTFSAPESAPSAPSGQTANYIQDASKYRPTYDPSREGRARQSQIEQAVMCPLCNSALGIPSTRPIKVTCPSCLAESTFTS